VEIPNKTANSGYKAFDKIASATSQAAEAFNKKGGEFNDQQRLMKNCRSYVRDKPVTSVGIALAAGFLLGRL
jgi:ElaB/YqjD/DUF883 family membrane-anchored ribosome-binding protein